MSSPLRQPSAPMGRKPQPHPYRKTLTPGGSWCTQAVARGKTCGQPENHPIHQPPTTPTTEK